jgi:S-DNA-T family DNA segregation ATPase FtsK/SpoIIIE
MSDRSPAGAARAARSQRAPIPLSVASRRHRFRYEVIGLALFTAGLLLLTGTGKHSGLIGPFLHHSLAFLVGTIGAVAVAIGLLVLGSAMVLRAERVEFGRLAAGFGILVWIGIAGCQLAADGVGVLGREFAAEPGGLFGVLLAELARWLFGRPFGAFVLLLAGVCALGYISDTPLLKIFQGAAWVVAFLAKAAFKGLMSVRLPKLPRRKSRPPEQTKRPRKVEPPKPPEPPKPQPEPAETPPKPQPTGKPQLQLITTEEEDSEPGEGYEHYVIPPLDLLSEAPSSEEARQEALASRDTLETALADYGIEAKVVEVERGPRVTRYEILLPPGVRVGRVTNLADDLAYALKALAVRVEAPVPGKGVIGIEVPNAEVTFVHLREILESRAAERERSRIAFALGRDISGHPMMADLATMPHLLIAGATNSGKSVCLNSMISSILFRARPDEVKFLLIDPKRVELSLFEGIPHLAAPVAHDARESAGLLRWAIREMDCRYDQFAELGVRNLNGWNERARMDSDIEPLYQLVIVIDELADLMMQAATEFEVSICRLAQLARATGIHLVVATQRPSVNVITGTIKANIPSRIAFAVTSQVDSRTILDINGAERLVGSGDMLFLPIDASTGKPVRIQGVYISERDIGALVEFLKQQARPEYADGALESVGSVVLPGKGEEDDDPMFQKALEFVLATKHASASMLQRKFKLGYTRAARMIDMMEERGYVGPHDGKRPREVYGGRTDRLAEQTQREEEEDSESEEEPEGFDDE